MTLLRNPAPLQVEQGLLSFRAPVITSDRAARADHPVAGDEQGDLVRAAGGTDGPRRTRQAEPGGNFAVSPRLAAGDLAERFPNAPLERGPGRVERQVGARVSFVQKRPQ